MISRYQNDDMKKIWSEENKYMSWLKVEILAAKALSEMGEIPHADVIKIENNASFNIKRIHEIEAKTRHDVVAFTRCVSESLGEEAKWIHYGLTSTDVVDTAYGHLYKQANELILTQLHSLQEALKIKAIKYKNTVMMGRTHGVHAELTTFGYKMALYYEEINRNIKRFEFAKKEVECGKVSGAVGTYANIDPKVQDYICKNLGIESSKISTQTLQRDRHAFYFSTLAVIGDSLDKLATEFRHLQRTELREVEEGFARGQKGSSAMPHKKNPISSENISGLSRILRGFSVSAHENVALWHERDISHSSSERILSEEATSLLEYMLKRMTNVVNNLNVIEDNMTQNILSTNNVFFSQRVLLKLIDKGMVREEAYDIVQPIAIDSFNNNKDFKIEMKNKLNNILDVKEFEDCFRTDYHLKNISIIYKRLGLEE